MDKYLKGRHFIIILVAFISLYLAASYLQNATTPSEQWSLTEDGLLSYPKNRGPVDYKEQVLNDTEKETLKKIFR